MARNAVAAAMTMREAIKSKVLLSSASAYAYLHRSKQKTFIHFSNYDLMQHRSLSSSSSSSSSSDKSHKNIILIESVAELVSAAKKVQDESFPAVFNFTFEEHPYPYPSDSYYNSFEYNEYKKTVEMYPHVTFYTVCMNKRELLKNWGKWKIDSRHRNDQPTYFLFKNGESVGRLGSFSDGLTKAMEKHYNKIIAN